MVCKISRGVQLLFDATKDPKLVEGFGEGVESARLSFIVGCVD